MNMLGMNLLFALLGVMCVLYYLVYGLSGYNKFSKEEKTTPTERIIYNVKTIQLLYFSNIVAVIFMIFAVITSTVMPVAIILGAIDMLMIFVSFFLSRDLFKVR